MRAHDPVGSVDIAPAQFIHDQIVLEAEHFLFLIAERISEQIGSVDQPKPRDFLHEVLAPAEFIKIEVEFVMTLEIFAVVALTASRAVKQVLKLCDVLVGNDVNGEPRGIAFEQRPHLGKINYLLSGVTADGGATVRDELKKAFCVELV